MTYCMSHMDYIYSAFCVFNTWRLLYAFYVWKLAKHKSHTGSERWGRLNNDQMNNDLSDSDDVYWLLLGCNSNSGQKKPSADHNGALERVRQWHGFSAHISSCVLKPLSLFPSLLILIVCVCLYMSEHCGMSWVELGHPFNLSAAALHSTPPTQAMRRRHTDRDTAPPADGELGNRAWSRSSATSALCLFF